jgi:tetratricopeptide (TPR) repeat protein
MPGFSSNQTSFFNRLRGPGLWLGGGVLVVTVFFLRLPGDTRGPDAKSKAPHVAVAPAVATAGNVAHDVVAREEQLLARLRSDPDNLIARIELARFYQDSHRPRAAIEHYEFLLASRPEDRQVWVDFTVCLGEAGEWERARTVMADFLDRWPDDLEGMYNLGAIYANSGDRDQAKTWWNRVAQQEIDPDLAAKASAAISKI